MYGTLVQHMLEKLHTLVQREIGEDRCPFDLELFGTRETRTGDGRERPGPEPGGPEHRQQAAE